MFRSDPQLLFSTPILLLARAQLHLRQILAYLNMLINQPEVLISHAMDRFDQEGNLTDVPTREHIIGLYRISWTGPGASGRNETGRAIPIYK